MQASPEELRDAPRQRLRQVAAARPDRVHRGDSAHRDRQVQEDRAARALRRHRRLARLTLRPRLPVPGRASTPVAASASRPSHSVRRFAGHRPGANRRSRSVAQPFAVARPIAPTGGSSRHSATARQVRLAGSLAHGRGSDSRPDRHRPREVGSTGIRPARRARQRRHDVARRLRVTSSGHDVRAGRLHARVERTMRVSGRLRPWPPAPWSASRLRPRRSWLLTQCLGEDRGGQGDLAGEHGAGADLGELVRLALAVAAEQLEALTLRGQGGAAAVGADDQAGQRDRPVVVAVLEQPARR